MLQVLFFLCLSQQASGLIFFYAQANMFQVFSLLLNGLFNKVNINVTDFSLLKGLISGLLQSNLESPCGIPKWNPSLEYLRGLEITANFSGSKFKMLVIPEWKKKSKHISKGITWNQQILSINDWTL